MVILSHKDFIESLEPLKALRESQGYTVALVDVEDIYDEFSFGQKTPLALKTFLRWARAHWRGPPRFVLLAGDASFDPRNYLSLGEFDYVPTGLVDTDYSRPLRTTGSWISTGTACHEIAVGRIPVRTAEGGGI